MTIDVTVVNEMDEYYSEPDFNKPPFDYEPWVGVILFAVLIVAVACLGGCSTLPKHVDIPVPVVIHCTANVGPEPDYPDTPVKLKAAPDIFEAAKLLLEGRVMRIEYESELKSALQACSAPPSDQPQHP